MWVGGGAEEEGGREKIPSQLCAECGAWRGALNHNPVSWPQLKSRVDAQLTKPPGCPQLFSGSSGAYSIHLIGICLTPVT